jgi:hypothetical protein
LRVVVLLSTSRVDSSCVFLVEVQDGRTQTFPPLCLYRNGQGRDLPAQQSVKTPVDAPVAKAVVIDHQTYAEIGWVASLL